MADQHQEMLIKIEGLHKRFGDNVVLSGASLEVPRGSLVAVLGRIGSGKSVFLKCLAEVIDPDAGEICFDGRLLGKGDTAARQDFRRRCGFLFQSNALFDSLTALENVALPLLYAGVPRRLRRARALQGLRDVGLADRAEHWPSQLSGGQQQRVALARALVNDPDLILADEPTGALDTRTSLEVMVVLQSLNRRGITLLVVTHEPEIAAFAGRRIDFRDGRLVSDLRQVPHDAARALAKLEGAAVGTEPV